MASSISFRHRGTELTSAIALEGVKASKADVAIRTEADTEERKLTSDMADKAKSIAKLADILEEE